MNDDKDKRCIFCRGKATGKFYRSKEHVLGQWLQRGLFSYNQNLKGRRNHLENQAVSDTEFVVRLGEFAKAGHGLHRTVAGVVCNTCNNGWLSDIQNAAKKPFTKIHNIGPVSLSVSDQKDLARWVSLFTIYCRNALDDSALNVGDVSGQFDRRQIRRLFSVDHEGFYSDSRIPENWRVFAIRTNPCRTDLGGHNLLPHGMSFYEDTPNKLHDWLFVNLCFVGTSSYLITNMYSIFPSEVRVRLYELGMRELAASNAVEIDFSDKQVDGDIFEREAISWISKVRLSIGAPEVRLNHASYLPWEGECISERAKS
ncbi:MULTISPECIES: hypothetical protein [Roseobacteraceae]|uniref:hypothetical protein n=1 Tax=Roseobacteraceae TaxID=2854170 RepID=UPI001C4592D3|nr:MULTISPECIES: hypothetical protein [Roseobacteraceae]MBV7408889.1 hypothetical protein [Maritimibacter sp. DP1N21-5]MBY5934424.1 hypothetical protein [Tateyamaria omphalii]